MISFYMSIEWMSTYLYVVKCPGFHLEYVYMKLCLWLGVQWRFVCSYKFSQEVQALNLTMWINPDINNNTSYSH